MLKEEIWRSGPGFKVIWNKREAMGKRDEDEKRKCGILNMFPTLVWIKEALPFIRIGVLSIIS